jgi:PIN domain nuclease of toxin-antitoxin system
LRALVDSHALLWFLNGDVPLGPAAGAFMRSKTNQPSVSIGSCWELAIKVSIGKLRFPAPFDEFLWPQLLLNRIEVLPIRAEHLNQIGSLPHHHRDPFDRLFVAQAIVEGVPIISADAALDAYGIERLWA